MLLLERNFRIQWYSIAYRSKLCYNNIYETIRKAVLPLRTLTCIVPPERGGCALRAILRGELHLSYTLLKSLKWRPGAILLNGAPARVDATVRPGDEVTVTLSERRQPSGFVAPCDLPLDIVYADDDLLVINKPAMVAMHPKSGEPETPSMAGALLAYLGEGTTAHFVSRLDKGTSGLFVAAKSGYIHDRLRRSLHSDALEREYRAVAVGRVEPSRGTIDLPIGRAAGSIVRRCVCEGGLPSRTDYEVLSGSEEFTYLRLLPHTGRTHQLRVHMSALGYPLAGDWLYGTEAPELIPRPALHSYQLRLTQPVTGKELCFTAPLPEDMRRLLHRAGSANCR